MKREVDITDPMLDFREAVRHSWNTYFAQTSIRTSPDSQEAFDEIERGFFRGIVLAPLGVSALADEYRRGALTWITVVPISTLGELPLQYAEIESNGNVKWEPRSRIQVHGKVEFEFIDFFDWDPYGFIDLHFVRAKVRVIASSPESTGRLTLIEQRHCRYIFSDRS